MESEPVRDLVGGMERGEVCPDALSPQELSACLMREGRLLRTVTDATCQSLRLGKAECEAAHAQASQMLRRFGLAGDSALLRLAARLLAHPLSLGTSLVRVRVRARARVRVRSSVGGAIRSAPVTWEIQGDIGRYREI